MIWEHFKTFCWLRWRLLRNQLKRGGIANTVILALIALMVVGTMIGFFFGAFFLGWLAMPHAPDVVVALVWDGMVVALLFSWMIGVTTELQRSEDLSLGKFLHLPVSLTGAFFINYLSSYLSLTLMVAVPTMIGFTLGLTLSKGPAMLLLLPAVAALVLMITTVTYQFQGWLATLMVNKRRRRTIVVLITGGVILMAQLPNLINVLRPWENLEKGRNERRDQERTELQAEFAKGGMNADEFRQRQQAITDKYRVESEEEDKETWAKTESVSDTVNVVVPLGWIAWSAQRLAQGIVWPVFLCTMAFTFVAGISFRRAYRTTLRLYTGQFTTGREAPAKELPKKKIDKSKIQFLERSLPWVSESVSAIALASFRSLLRAPEAKMALLTPVILLVVFGGIFFAHGSKLPERFWPLLPFGGVATMMLSFIQLIGNQFGFERNGFRVYVLSPVPRRDVLLGKNLAVAPMALGLAFVVIVIAQIVRPLRWDFFLATFPLALAMFFLYCALVNCLSVWAPMKMAPGSLKASNPKALTILLQVLLVFALPVILTPAVVPIALQIFLDWLEVSHGIPVGLLLAVLECVLAGLLYRVVLTWEGAMLQAREQKILEVVATRAE